MTQERKEGVIVGLGQWLRTPPGRYLLAWEQARLDEIVVDMFGFHALQLGLPQLAGLAANRMPHRWLALNSHDDAERPLPDVAHWPGADAEAYADADALASVFAEGAAPQSVALLTDFDALPFEANSLDLVLLPHTLELTADPHQALREVERVLRPEGRLVVVGLNPASLWGLRQNLGRLRDRLMPSLDDSLFLPRAGEFIGYWRLRDWLRLLSFEIDSAHFGCYRPPLRSERWLARWEWLERLGPRWWPVLGAVYCVTAVKRVHGMRLVGLLRSKRPAGAAAPAVALHQQHFSGAPAASAAASSSTTSVSKLP
ncbi:class I SAM-dependent methyltransferase [Paucibacter sp. APW11]|uniref:Class I SAM-dependent methyltransferase n=1 Tax=Roseateles aquae TaxID=3077235 RepID=A0ABU3P784_9BURK|nr:class I SAM-dependent methyltransferase [Paucibacter sp. APW11]MDT8998448.1 class I SAM-dependent methyltransferase [Paucibacter sp. APW11]